MARVGEHPFEVDAAGLEVPLEPREVLQQVLATRQAEVVAGRRERPGGGRHHVACPGRVEGAGVPAEAHASLLDRGPSTRPGHAEAGADLEGAVGDRLRLVEGARLVQRRDELGQELDGLGRVGAEQRHGAAEQDDDARDVAAGEGEVGGGREALAGLPLQVGSWPGDLPGRLRRELEVQPDGGVGLREAVRVRGELAPPAARAAPRAAPWSAWRTRRRG